MTDFKITEVEQATYLYCERSCSMDPGDISRTMGSAFRTVLDFIAMNAVAGVDKPLAVYEDHDPQRMTFKAGFLVPAAAAAKASGDVRAGTLPAGRVVRYVHRGPYAKLRVSYGDMMRYLETNGLAIGGPAWEVYLNDPAQVPEDQLETEVFVALATG